jgi:hypothetical protein
MADPDRVVAAHEQTETLHIVTSIPDHAPRETDPHHRLFMQAKARLKRQGLWKCILDDHASAGVPELHHSHLEFSQINAFDFAKVNEALGLHLGDDEAFQQWAESPGNLEVLCSAHHRTALGVHVLPGPLWEPMRFRKAGLEPPARLYTEAQWKAREAAKEHDQ